MTGRRRFLGAILASAVAPAIVRASSLMPVKALAEGYEHSAMFYSSELGGYVFWDEQPERVWFMRTDAEITDYKGRIWSIR